MAWPWLAVAVKTIPWTALVRRAPDIMQAYKLLISAAEDIEGEDPDFAAYQRAAIPDHATHANELLSGAWAAEF